jgi:hypothetical protein
MPVDNLNTTAIEKLAVDTIETFDLLRQLP